MCDLPLRSLSSTNVGRRLLSFFAQSSRTVRILLSDRLSVGQVLGSVDDGDKGADGWPIY